MIFIDNSHQTLYIFAGSDYRYSGEIRYKTKQTEYHIHPNGVLGYWDFGIIELEFPFRITTDSEERYTINTVCLPLDEPELHEYTEDATVFGWGSVKCCEKKAKILQKTVVNVRLKDALICTHNEYYCSLRNDCKSFPDSIHTCPVKY